MQQHNWTMELIKHNTDKFVGLAVTLFFFLAMGSGLVRNLDWTVYGLGQRVTPPRTPSKDVVVIAIDDYSLETLGDWPWTRDTLSNLIRRLNIANSKVIGLNLPFDKPQNELSLTALREFQGKYNRQLNETARTLLDRVVHQLNTDLTLSRVMTSSKSIVLGVPYNNQRFKPKDTPGLPGLLTAQVIEDIHGTPPQIYKHTAEWLHPDQSIYATTFLMPTQQIGSSAAGLAPSLGTPIIDGSLAARPVSLSYSNYQLPSFALLITAMAQGRATPLQLMHGEGVQVGNLFIDTDTKFRAYPFYYQSKGTLPAFQVYSLAKVLNGDIKLDTFQDKIVLIGPSSEQLVTHHKIPNGQLLPPVLVEAHTISSLLQGDLFQVPMWSYWARYVFFLLVAVYLMYFLPRLSIGTGIAVSSLILVVMFNLIFISMAFASAWVALMGPATALIVGHLLLGTKHIVFNKIEKYKKALSDSNRLLGQAYQFQGQLDLAFEKYRLCTVDEELLSLSYNLGLDYERKRQFNKAANVFRFIRRHKSNYRDTRERVEKNLQTSNAVVLGNQNTSAESTLVLDNSGVQKPMLGRYQIESELGRGAMGIVYLGSDPKIGRTVAIKTMPLSSEFEEDQLEEIKSRFFREAKTAGRLNHYNIVTIYDVGEEQDLAYIAMDYLQGMDMSQFTKKDKLLKVADVFNVITQVADALHYAHNQNVVHRDIKPANILYDRRTKKPTVTDFGVAHLTDTSKTKTGTILGTPSFMSPEQLAGDKIDGRSDLFSLGVTFFQLLTGELPFKAENISTLMFKIANEEPRDILELRPALPACIKSVVNKSLQKDPEQRFQTGGEFMQAIKRCHQSIISQNKR